MTTDGPPLRVFFLILRSMATPFHWQGGFIYYDGYVASLGDFFKYEGSAIL